MKIFNQGKLRVLEVDFSEEIAAQNKFGGVKRSDLKPDDFLFPATKSFPIKTAQDVRDALNNFGRMKNGMSYDDFVKKLWQKAKSKGLESGIPDSTRKEHNLS
jgi:hypothetical protein